MTVRRQTEASEGSDDESEELGDGGDAGDARGGGVLKDLGGAPAKLANGTEEKQEFLGSLRIDHDPDGDQSSSDSEEEEDERSETTDEDWVSRCVRDYDDGWRDSDLAEKQANEEESLEWRAQDAGGVSPSGSIMAAN